MSDAMRRLLDSLYTDAMLLADEARAYFESIGRDERDGLDPLLRVAFSCESLKLTTRLMHVVAWLLTRRGVDAGELSAAEALARAHRLGESPCSEVVVLAAMPPGAAELVARSEALHRRAAALDGALADDFAAPSGARFLQDRLAAFF